MMKSVYTAAAAAFASNLAIAVEGSSSFYSSSQEPQEPVFLLNIDAQEFMFS